MITPKPDRRGFLLGGIAVVAVPAAAWSASFSGTGMAWSPNTTAIPPGIDGSGYKYFTADEAQFIEAACARIIPNDATGPGAIEAGVPFFIDRQLAGEYGAGGRWYMQGPVGAAPTKTQGYQSRYPPAGQYRAAIKAVGDHLANSGKPFHQREAADQDAFLKDLEAGKVDLGADVNAKAWFTLLLQNVMEGYFSDPIYGGNRGMAPWKMIGFPGARYDQRAYVLTYGKSYPLPPVGIAGRPAWSGNS